MFRSLSIPKTVLFLFLGDALLLLGMVVIYWHQHLGDFLSRILNLGEEAGLGTWFSSLQWALVGILAWRLHRTHFQRKERGSFFLLGFPLVFFAFSIDEIAQIHESLGQIVDQIVMDSNYQESWFHLTGVWTIAVGLPVVLCLALLFFLLRRFFPFRRGGQLVLLGFLVFFLGALGMETISNVFQSSQDWGLVIETTLEEGMEMIGITLLYWGFHNLLVGNRAETALLPIPPSEALGQPSASLPHPSQSQGSKRRGTG
ncbi:MAG TPA: hypothetical protein ENK02_08565 [Planctomycetes bacterium]|nr:hypothetical protein [Planctomycetota bacterium]